MPELAIFARNHRRYLEYAATLIPRALVTFRSSREWATAARALDRTGPGTIPVFFAVVGEPDVQFRAKLEAVKLRPTLADQATKRLLALVPPDTFDEGLWHEGSGTLYSVSSCERLTEHFPLGRLLKFKGLSPLSEEFRYSYALVTTPPDMT